MNVTIPRVRDILDYVKTHPRMVFPLIGYFIAAIPIAIAYFTGPPMIYVLWPCVVGLVVAIYGYLVYPEFEKK